VDWREYPDSKFLKTKFNACGILDTERETIIKEGDLIKTFKTHTWYNNSPSNLLSSEQSKPPQETGSMLIFEFDEENISANC